MERYYIEIYEVAKTTPVVSLVVARNKFSSAFVEANISFVIQQMPGRLRII